MVKRNKGEKVKIIHFDFCDRTKKMAAKALEPLFAELDDFIKDGDWGQALAASEKSTIIAPKQ